MAVSSKTQKGQLGAEGTGTPTWGASASASTVWLGTVRMVDETEVRFIEESIGFYGGYGRTYVPKEGAAITFESVPAAFEQIGYPMEAGLNAASTSASGSLFLYSYAMSTSSEQTIRTYSLEVGDNEDVELAEYCFCGSYTLTGSFDEAVELTSTWHGRQVTAGNFTVGVSKPTVQPIIFNTGTLYIDASGGTMGTTQVSNSFRSFSLSVNTGLQPVQTADGQLYFTFHKVVDPEVMLEITAEHTSDWDSAGEKAAWRAETGRLVRLNFTGSSGRRLTIDLAGKWESFSAIEESDGNSVLTGTMRGYWSSTDAVFFETVVANLLSALP